MSDEPDQKPDGQPKEPAKLSFSLPQLLGSGAAAATVAFIGSSLGTAGTIFGAALASVLGAVAGTIYTAGLDRTGRRLGTVMQRGWDRIRRADPELDEGEDVPSSDPGAADPEPPHGKGRTWRRVLTRTLLAAVAIFAVAFVAITGWELVTGRTLDGKDGTTVGQVVQPERSPKPTPAPSEPTASTTAPEPTPTPTPTPSETPVEPSPSPTPTPTPSETVEPTPTPTPTATPTEAAPEGGEPAAADPAE